VHPRTTTCPTASDPGPQPRWALGLPRVQQLRNPPPWWEGLRCHHTSCSTLWATGLKHKEKSSMSACAARPACSQRMHTFPRRLTSGPSWAYKTCGQTAQSMFAWRADMQLQCSTTTVDHLPSTSTVPGDSTARCHTADRVQCGRMTRPYVPTSLKTSFANFTR
jgi:hypothetical protein